MSRLLLNRDPWARKETEFVSGPDGFGAVTRQNVDHIMNAAKREANNAGPLKHRRHASDHHVRKVAEIPTTIYFAWVKEYGRPDQNPDKWKSLMNDPDFQHFRTGGGKL